MKKVLIILTLILIFPIMVNAKEYCKVISGDGKSLGSEIACGSEHFYVLSSNENEVRMLAKYNLYTGISIYKEKIEKEPGDTRSDEQYCRDLATSKKGEVKSDAFYYDPGYCFYKIKHLKEGDYYDPISMDSSDTRTKEEYCRDYATQKGGEYVEVVENYYCRYKKMFTGFNLQSEDAKSAHWDGDLNYLYPQVGDVYAGGEGDTISFHEEPVKENTTFRDFDVNLSSLNDSAIENAYHYGNESGLTRPLYVYRYLLQQMGYSINSISLLSVSEMDSIAKKLTNQSLPLKEWNDNFEVMNNGTYEIHFGDLKPYFKDQTWLYSTTYWNSTGFFNDSTYGGLYYVFTAEQGKLCGAGFQACAPSTTLGCGIRPVVAVAKDSLMYIIRTKTDGNGTIEVVENAAGGDQITFKATPKKGYKLKSIVVKTDSGETVEFTKGEMITNSDGTISIDKNKFTMPFENITIEGNWELDIINPKTGRNILVIISIIGLIGISLKIKNKKVSS